MTGERVVIGVDPGPSHTGVVARCGAEVLNYHCFAPDDGEPVEVFAEAVAVAVLRIADEHDLSFPWEVIAENIRDGLQDDYESPLIGIEGVAPPVGAMGMIDPGPLLNTALIAGWVAGRLGSFFDVVIVPPAGFGRGPLAAYPSVLWSERETTGNGKGPRQHTRAAYDVSIAAPTYWTAALAEGRKPKEIGPRDTMTQVGRGA